MKSKFKDFLKESIQPEISKLDMKLEDIFEIYITYDDVTEFLNKELKDKKVIVSRLYIYDDNDDREYLRDITIDVDSVELAARNLVFIFTDKNGKDYYVPDDARLKWEKPITRKITDLDPYGEDEDEE